MIIIDLEWNRSYDKIPLEEILQIGAVKIDRMGGPILDTCTVFLLQSEITAASAAAQYAAGLPVNISQAIATFLVIRFLGEPLLEKLDRVKVQYGMMEDDDGI